MKQVYAKTRKSYHWNEVACIAQPYLYTHLRDCREESSESYLCLVEPVFQIVPPPRASLSFDRLSAVSWRVNKRVHETNVGSGVDG